MRKSYLKDAELISLYRTKDDEAAFAELLDRHKARVYTTIYLIVKDRYLAEDLLQEVFIKAIDRIRRDNYLEEGKFGPWVQRIAHNLAIDHFRKIKRHPVILTEEGSPLFNSMDFVEDSRESVQIQEDTVSKIRQIIDTLPTSQREVLIMRQYSGMSFQEIAETTGVSINTALGRMRYALINIRKKLEEIERAYDKNFYHE